MTKHFRTTTGIALTALIVLATTLLATWGSAPAAAQDGPTPVPDRANVPLEIEIIRQYELSTGTADLRLTPDGEIYFMSPDGILTRGGPGGVEQLSLLGEEPIYYPGALMQIHFAMGDGSVRIGPHGALLTPSSFFDEADALQDSISRGPFIVVGPNGLPYQIGGSSGDAQPMESLSLNILPYMEQQNIYKMAAAPNGDLVFAVETPDGIAMERQGWTPSGEPVAQWDGFFLPEVNDEVLTVTGLYPAADGSVWIEFEEGDLSMPFVARIDPNGQSTPLLLPAVQALTPYTPGTANGIIAILIGFTADGQVLRAGPEDEAFTTWFTVDDLQTDTVRWSNPQITGILTDEYGRLYVVVASITEIAVVKMNADGTVDDAWNLAEIAPDCADCAITLAAGPGGELYAYAEGQAGLARLGPSGLVQHVLSGDPDQPVILGLRVGPNGQVHVATGDINGDGVAEIITYHIGP